MSKKSDAIKALRAVAAGHYNKTLAPRAKQAGVCWACGHQEDVGLPSLNEVYFTVAKWCDVHSPGKGLYLCKPGTRWNQRAMFALLLAESMS